MSPGWRLTGLTLSRLPERPNFVLCATDMAFGVNWIFERTRLGDYQAAELVQAVEGAEVEGRRAEAPAGKVAVAVTPGSRNH